MHETSVPTRRTTLSAASAALAESCWLAAVVVVPVFFNVHSARTFEEDKVPLLRSFTLIILLALVVRAFEEGRQAWAIRGRPFWRVPLVATALVLAGAYVVSTVFSISPRVSVWGSYERAQGLYTWCAYVVVFVAIVVLLRTREQVDRLITAILLSSVPPSMYAIVQHFGFDPIRWGLDVTIRPHGTGGNPIFLSAYLIMVVPLTLMRALDRCGQLGSSGVRTAVAAGTYVALLAAQFLAILYTQSRGPLLGFGVGLLFVLLLLAPRRRLRWFTITLSGLVVGSTLFLVLLNVAPGPLAPLQQAPSLKRFSRLFESGSGTGKVRVVIWEGATNLLAANPVRDLIGYGPETLFLAYTRFYPPELARYESRRVAPDRAHNETFDALIMIGVVGCTALYVFFGALLSALLRWLGWITTPGQRRVFLIATTAGALVGGLGPYLLEGSFRYSGLCMPMGMVAGLLVYLLIDALGNPRQPAVVPQWQTLTLLGVLGALLGHFVEIQFGIAVTTTRLLFWVYAGLAIALGLTISAEEGSEGTPTTAEAPVTMDGLVIGLLLAVLTFDFYRPAVDLGQHAGALLTLFLSTWLFGALIATADSSGPTLRRLVRYGAVSLLVWVAFGAIHVEWFRWRPNLDPFQLDRVLPAGKHLANCISIFYLFAFAVIGLATAALLWPARPAQRYRRGWHLGLAAVLLAASVPVIVRTNVDVSRADIFLKQVDFYTRHQHLDGAQVVAEEAQRLDPGLSHYTTALVRVLMDLAQAQPEQRTTYLLQAQTALERMQARDPLNMDNTRNLARLHRLWGALATDAAEQARHLDTADAYYAHATLLSPNNASLWNERALLHSERRQTDEAMRLLDHSLAIDDGYTTTWWMRANVHEQTDAFELAVADYDRALAIDPKLLAAWSGKALALARLDRLDEAIAATEEAVKVAPRDLINRRNLALLYYRAGQLGPALEEAIAALAVAKKPKDKSDLEAFIHQIQDAATPE